MSKESGNRFFIGQWDQSDEVTIPHEIDIRTKTLLLDKFYDLHATGKQSKVSMNIVFALAASLLIALITWNFIRNNEGIDSSHLLVDVINRSQQLEANYHLQRNNHLNEYSYLKKFQLEKELMSINYKLSVAYFEQENLQQKLQLWNQKNQTLSQLNALLAGPDNISTVHI